MLQHLDDPNPPEFGALELGHALRRGSARQRRTRLGAISAVTVPSLVLGGVLLGRATADAPDRVVTSQPSPTVTPTVPDDTLPLTVDPTVSATIEAATTTTLDPVAATEFPLLGDRDTSLGVDEWLLPLDLPDGYEQRGASINYQLGVGPDGKPDVSGESRVRVRAMSIVDVKADDASVELPATPAGLSQIDIEINERPLGITSFNGSALATTEIGGVEWQLSTSDGPSLGYDHLAERWVGEGSVVVRAIGTAIGEEQFLRVVESLAIVPRSEVSEPVIDPWSPDTIEIAEVDAFGESYSVRLQTFDGVEGHDGPWTCRYELADLGYSTICGDDNVVDGVMTGVEFHNAHHNQETNELEVSAYGLVSHDVDRIELLMFNDEVVTVRPESTVEALDRDAWVMVGSFPIGQRLDLGEFPVFLPPTIQSITAYDIDGNVLATDVVDDWRDE
jgi:hypothetical protein